MNKLVEILTQRHESPEQARLAHRISELEAENAQLRQLEETVRRNAKIIEALLARSREGFLLLTPQLTFLRMIHSALGVPDASLEGRPLQTMIHPGDHGRIADDFARLAANPQQSLTSEWRVNDGSGKWHWMEVEMTDMLDDPDIQAIVVTSRDITERKACQEAHKALRPAAECPFCPGPSN